MEMFISWSGDSSQQVAKALRRFIRHVVPAAKPWMSTRIPAGARWNKKLSARLNKSNFGIICLTKSNLTSAWILFETGALAKTFEKSVVCPYLIALEPSEIPAGPINQFQAKRANSKDTWSLISRINRLLQKDAVPKRRLKRAFKRWWPELESVIGSLKDDELTEEQKRTQSAEVLDKFLEIGMEMAYSKLDHPTLEKDMQAAKDIRVLKTWFPETREIQDGLSKAIQRGAKVTLLLCDPDSVLLKQRSSSANKPDLEGSATVYHCISNIHDWVSKPRKTEDIRIRAKTPKSAGSTKAEESKFDDESELNVHIALYDSWPGCPVIWYDKGDKEKIVMGFYLRGAPSPEWPWIRLTRNKTLANAVEKQFDELWDMSTVHLKTIKQIKEWLEKNIKWKMSESPISRRRTGKTRG